MGESEEFDSLSEYMKSHMDKLYAQGPSLGFRLPKFMCQQTNERSSQGISLSEDAFHSSQNETATASSEPSIREILARQIANTRAREQREKEEKQKLEEEKERLRREMEELTVKEESDDYVIDLVAAIQVPYTPPPKRVITPPVDEEEIRVLFQYAFSESDIELTEKNKVTTPEPLLPCTTDLSFLLGMKLKRKKCSPIGKLICKQYLSVASRHRIPYMIPKPEKFENVIKRFDFSTLSPDNEIKMGVRKPWQHSPIVI